jgi:hypothetical protein
MENIHVDVPGTYQSLIDSTKQARNDTRWVSERPSKETVKAANYYKVEQVHTELLQEWVVPVNTCCHVFKNVTISKEGRT